MLIFSDIGKSLVMPQGLHASHTTNHAQAERNETLRGQL